MCPSHQKNRLICCPISHVIMRHSFMRFISGFLELIQSASRVLRACVLDSCARIVTCTSKSSPLCLWVLCVPNGYLVYVCRLGVLSCGHRYDLMQSPSLPLGVEFLLPAEEKMMALIKKLQGADGKLTRERMWYQDDVIMSKTISTTNLC
uniref:RING-type E3 ubiquitin transferase n=1 Tax=Angiostrongylus cantonensis TaxID=6313 RepID=A0A0K0D424_ANGCA